MKKYEKDLSYLLNKSNDNRGLTLFDVNLTDSDLKILVAKNLIQTKYYMDRNCLISITSKGLTYFEDKKSILLSKLIWSVLAPIGISIVTTLLTIWITSLLE